MFKIIFSCFFIFCFSFGFSNEIRQGTLQNGLQYYLWPDNGEENSSENAFPFFEEGDSITFVINKPANLLFFPTSTLFKNRNFFEFIGVREGATTSITQDEFSICSMSFYGNLQNCKNLPNFAEFFRFENISNQTIQKLRKNYWKNRDDLEDFGSYLLVSHIYECDLEKEDSLFSEDNATMNETLRSLFDPSQMAVMITGRFDADELEQKLEALFGEIPNSPVSLSPITFKPNGSIVIACKSYGLDDDDDDDDEDVEEVFLGMVYLYFYQFEPTFKNHVLNDLLFHMKLDIQNGFCGSSSVGKLCPVTQFLSREKITTSQFDEARFHKAKRKLEKVYLNDYTTNKQMQCTNHFLSNIPEALEAHHQNLLRELHSVSFEEFCAFVEQHIVNATEWQEDEIIPVRAI